MDYRGPPLRAGLGVSIPHGVVRVGEYVVEMAGKGLLFMGMDLGLGAEGLAAA